MPGSCRIAVLALVAAFALPGGADAAPIPNTGPGSDPEAGFGHVDGSPHVRLDRLLDTPFDPEDGDPAEAAATAALWSPGTPENDLARALDAMAGATSASDADHARAGAIDILEGNPVSKRAYSGIPLLNWDAPAKVKTVPAGGTVEVVSVRWGEHMVSDTWLLQFADPDQPFRIRYRVAELAGAFGGRLNPTPLLNEGGAPAGGQLSAIQPLGIEDGLDLGTHQGNRFTDDRGLGAVAEKTRAAVQEITVAMPPPRNVTAILDPNLRPGHESAAALLPATPARIAAAQDALGFSGTAPTAAQKRAAIGRLADASPEKQIWLALEALPAAGDAGFLAAAQAAGAQNRELVGAMRSRNQLPAGVAADAGAHATLVLQNNETYLSRQNMRLNPGESLRVQIVNRDGFAHHLSAFDLHNRNRIFGAWDWGSFDWNEGALAGGSTTLAPDASRTFTITPAGDAFAVWLGDTDSGDQAHAVISLDRGIRHEALRFGAPTGPVHSAPDASGNVWVTLAGIDTIARVHPAASLADSAVDHFPLPGGRRDIDSPTPPLGPADITVDGKGIVWSTLASGNAIARINPALVRDGAEDGIKILPLDPCPVNPACIPVIPPVPNEQPTRSPGRLKSMIDGQGNTVLWFLEGGTSAVGVLRVSPDGEALDQAHYTCGCTGMESLDLGPDGSIWFAEIVENRLGRLRPDPARPYAPSAARLDHYKIPGETLVQQPPLFPRLMTALPLSVAVDGRGRVWFSESALSSIGFLDPGQAEPNTSRGFGQIELGHSAFRSPAAPADVHADRGNNVWWSGEYGDQIEQVRSDGSIGMKFRGSVRRGLTEGPISDKDGNLWVVETGGNLITRISGVTEGPLLGYGLPAGYEANTTSDTLTGERLRDTTSVEARVVRNGTVVAHAEVGVNDGRFAIGGGNWIGSSDEIRAEDAIRIQPRGPFARAELSFRVASLSGEGAADGTIAGHAMSDSHALGDRVDVSFESGSASSRVDGSDGSWRVTGRGGRSARGTVAWTGATVAGGFRTVTNFGPDAPSARPPARGTSPRPLGATARCAAGRHWLRGTARKPRLGLLGLTRKQLQSCLGKPASARKSTRRSPERRRYRGGLVVTLRGGRVTGFSLSGSALRSARGNVGIGSNVKRLRGVLAGLKKATGGRRVVVKQTAGRFRYADVRIKLDKRGRIRRIDVTQVRRPR